jgi:RNA polymerase sigma factor (TIGR02999 family)
MPTDAKKTVTQILQAWAAGDRSALDRLIPMVYRELRKTAGAYMRRERVGHTLQPTALINEAYLRLVDGPVMNWQNRAQFFGVAATVMRHVLTDYARARSAQKRGEGIQKLTLDEALAQGEEPDVDLVKLDEALTKFEKIDPKKSKIIELRFYGGLSIEETAEVLGVSPSTIKRDWRTARAWLRHELE